jgi:membrane protein DedA with SNARE-associated domain
LQSFEPPCLVVHGKKDLLVPYAAAIEHHRIVPQSELVTYETRGHFLLWQETESLSEVLREFFSEVDTGNARGRADAFSERVRSAEVPYEKTRTEPSQGLALIILLVIIVSGTWLSEDLTCLATGLLVARGRLTLSTGVLACSSGIVLGDLALYGLGRCLGRAALSRTPWRWFLRENSIRRAASWFERNGLSAVVLSRFLPGTRLPTFVAAGLVRTRLAPFALYLCLAAMVWTPLLVAGSAFASSEVLLVLRRADRTAPFLATVLLLWALLRLTVASGSTVRRRLWLGRIRRLTRWEFWPAQLFYVPVALYVLWLAIKHRSLKLVTAVNPGFPEGGFVGESKWEIFQGFSGEREHLAKTELLPAADLPPEKLRRIRNFVARESLVFPLVLKPDVGERGRGVSVVASLVEAERAVESLDRDYLVQEHVDGGEFGVFYVREPGMERGRIFSITRKILPELTGDGHSTLERLILEDERAVCGASAYLRANADRLDWVPARGERVRLVELGTHCRGAIFQDGADLRTPALEDAFDRISRALPGFFFGRYDLRAPSEERLRAGTGFKILELNGLTSEATHIYDPRNSPIDAYRVLFEQWRIAFRIAAENERRGVKPASLRNLLERFANYLKDPLRAM